MIQTFFSAPWFAGRRRVKFVGAIGVFGSLLLTPLYARAQAGNALQTDDAKYAEVADNPSLSVVGALTVTAWFRYGTFVARAGRIVSKAWSNQQDAISPYISYGLVVDEASDAADGPHLPNFSVGGAQGERGQVNGKTPLVAGQWAHLAGVFDPTAKKVMIYVNGVLDAEAAVSFSALADTNGSFWVGGDQQMAGYDQFVNGTVDEVTVWSRVLSAGEISSVMNNPPQAPTDGLVASWLFEQPSGALVDSSGHGSNATIVGGAQVVATGSPARAVVAQGGAGGAATRPDGVSATGGADNRAAVTSGNSDPGTFGTFDAGGGSSGPSAGKGDSGGCAVTLRAGDLPWAWSALLVAAAAGWAWRGKARRDKATGDRGQSLPLRR